MKLPKDDDDLRGDERFDEDREALFGSSASSNNTAPINPVVDCCVSGLAYVQFLWIFRKLECILALVLLFCLTLLVTGVVESYESKQHSFKGHQFYHDYSDLQSSLELKLKDIDHWCLDGRDDTCPKCDDPTHPISRGEFDGWKQAFMRNVKFSNAYRYKSKNPDVIFVGDGYVEATVGELRGVSGLEKTPAAKDLSLIKEFYDTMFTKSNGGQYDVLRLGIAGDTSPNLFWRLRQNEFRDLKPSIWWISIGRNDLFKTKCSEEVTLMGILRVIEEIVDRKDGATIVINSLLPTSNNDRMQLEGKGPRNEMWQSIKELNARLKKFAQRHDGIVFYSTDDVLVDTKGQKKFISKSYYADKLHPNFQGYQELAKNQLALIDHLMEKRESVQQNKPAATAGSTPAETAGSTTPAATAGGDSVEPEDMDYHENFLDADDYYGYIKHFEEDDFLSDFNLWDDFYGMGDDDW